MDLKEGSGGRAMVMPYVVLVVSTALFFFYLQATCERALQREFSHPYFREIVQAIQLEYPRLRDSYESNASPNYSDARLALECDFTALTYLVKRGGGASRRLSRPEKLLMLYFRVLLFSLPIRHALKLQERNAVLKSASILQYFANLTGETLNVSSLPNALPDLQS